MTTSKAAKWKPEKKQKATHSPELHREPAKHLHATSSPTLPDLSSSRFSSPSELSSFETTEVSFSTVDLAKPPMESPVLPPPDDTAFSQFNTSHITFSQFNTSHGCIASSR